MTPYPRGTVVYQPYSSWGTDPVDCPACLGAGRLSVKPFNGSDEDAIHVRCGYCARSQLGVGKVSDTFKFKPMVMNITIEGVVVEDTLGGTKITYKYNMSGGCCNLTDHERVYTDKKKAEEAAERMAVEAILKRALEVAKSKEQTAEDTGWSVGYNLEQVKTLIVDLEVAKTAAKRAEHSVSSIEASLNYSLDQVGLTRNDAAKKITRRFRNARLEELGLSDED